MADEQTGAQTNTDASTSGSQAGAAPEGTGQQATDPTQQAGTPGDGGQADGGDGAGTAADHGGEGQGEGGADDGGNPGAPESYGEFQMPEGVEVDQQALEQFTPVAQELGLSQDQAQQLVDVYAQMQKDAVEAQQSQWSEQLDQWVDEVRNDEELGGRNYDRTISQASAAMDKFATPELRQALDDSGLGNHPEMVRLMSRIGKAVGEDSMLNAPGTSGSQGPAEKSIADALYGNSNQ